MRRTWSCEFPLLPAKIMNWCEIVSSTYLSTFWLLSTLIEDTLVKADKPRSSGPSTCWPEFTLYQIIYCCLCGYDIRSYWPPALTRHTNLLTKNPSLGGKMQLPSPADIAKSHNPTSLPVRGWKRPWPFWNGKLRVILFICLHLQSPFNRMSSISRSGSRWNLSPASLFCTNVYCSNTIG